jgi:hypothetical protein
LADKKGVRPHDLTLLIFVAGATRLELATSGVTGRRSNQLNYAPEQVSTFHSLRLVGGTGFEPVTPGL